jgi:hypothetical protein
MTSVPSTVSTEDWLGSGKITSFPIPTETQTLSSPSEDEDVSPSDAERILRESAENEREESCTVG